MDYEVKRKNPDNLIPFDKGHARLINLEELSVGAGDLEFGVKRAGIWAGSPYFSGAPFQLTYAGALTATSANITGDINATGGSITGSFDITTTGGQISAYNDITSVHGAVNAYNGFHSSNGGLTVYNDIYSSHGSIHAQNDIYTDHGVGRFANGLTVPNGSLVVYNDITTTHGSLSVKNDITGTGKLTISDEMYGARSLTVNNDVYAHGSIHCETDLYTNGGEIRAYNDITSVHGKVKCADKFVCAGNEGWTVDYTVVTWISGSKFFTHNLKFRGGILIGESGESSHNI